MALCILIKLCCFHPHDHWDETTHRHVMMGAYPAWMGPGLGQWTRRALDHIGLLGILGAPLLMLDFGMAAMGSMRWREFLWSALAYGAMLLCFLALMMSALSGLR